jgi:hypothetical protein
MARDQDRPDAEAPCASRPQGDSDSEFKWMSDYGPKVDSYYKAPSYWNQIAGTPDLWVALCDASRKQSCSAIEACAVRKMGWGAPGRASHSFFVGGVGTCVRAPGGRSFSRYRGTARIGADECRIWAGGSTRTLWRVTHVSGRSRDRGRLARTASKHRWTSNFARRRCGWDTRGSGKSVRMSTFYQDGFTCPSNASPGTTER